MAAPVSIKVTGQKAVIRALKSIRVDLHPRILERALLAAGLKVQKVAATEKIIRGGGGPPHPTRLTSRTGTLRRSIGVDRGGLPFRISIGSGLVYARPHELGIGTPKRAYLEPAARDVAPQFPELVLREWKRALA